MKSVAIKGSLCLFCLVWIYSNYLLWQQDSQTKKIANDQVSAAEFEFIAFADQPLYSSIEKQLASGEVEFDFVEKQIALLQDYRPLFAPAWLQLAQLYFLKGDKDAAMENAHFAQQLWKNRGFHLYKIASFWVKVGDTDNAIRTLGRYIITHPDDIYSSLHMARLLSGDPQKMLTELYTVDNSELLNEQEAHEDIFDYALKQEDAELAQTTWNKFSSQLVINERLVGRYINFLIAQNDSELALTVWTAYSAIDISEKISNGGFENELSRLGFGWNFQQSDEYSWDIDDEIYHQGGKSLKLAFTGEHNVDFQHIRQIIPVEPGETYRFSGYWRGNGVSTTSTPYIELTPMYTIERQNARVGTNKGNWGWEKIEEFIEIPLQSNFLRVRIRRNQSSSLDRNISGRVWFDELKLEKISNEQLKFTSNL